MAYYRVRLPEPPGLGQWAAAVTAIAGAVGAIAPAVAQIVTKPPRPPSTVQIIAAAPTLAPSAVVPVAVPPPAYASTAAAGTLGGLPTWGWVALGGGGLLLMLLLTGSGRRPERVYVMAPRRR